MTVLVNLDGFDMGLSADETGLNMESFEQKTAKKEIEVPNRVGNTRGVALYDIHLEVTWSGETVADPTDEIGDIITLLNLVALGGVESGAVILYELTLTLGREAMRKLSGMAKQFPGIPAV